MTTLLVTNDFPPRPGGIQAFVHNLAIRQPADSLVVYASTWTRGRGLRRRAALRGHPRVHRNAAANPSGRTAGGEALAREHGCETVWFGAAAPLGLLAEGLRRRSGVERIVAQTHGHEVGWAALPGARTAAAPDRSRRRRHDLPRGVHPRSGWPGPRWCDHLWSVWPPAWTRSAFHPGVDGGRGPASVMAWWDGRWSCAFPGWFPARARTC